MVLSVMALLVTTVDADVSMETPAPRGEVLPERVELSIVRLPSPLIAMAPPATEAALPERVTRSIVT